MVIVARCRPNETGNQRSVSALEPTALESAAQLREAEIFSAAAAAKAARAFLHNMTAGRRLSSADFRTLRPSKRVQGTLFSLSIAVREAGAAWAVVVSKKVSRKAVARNLVKRRSRSVLARELKKFDEPRALILTAKRGAAEATFAETKKDIETLLDRAQLRGTMRRT